MSLSELVYARYLSGYSVKDISKELMIPEGRIDFQIIAVKLYLEQGLAPCQQTNFGFK